LVLPILELSKPISIIEEFPEIQYWYIGGHSLGGITAQAVINDYPNLFEGLILLGVYPAEGYSIKDWDNNVISIYAENDLISTTEEIMENKDFLPIGKMLEDIYNMDTMAIETPVTLYYLIEGGNHSQFGDYGFQKGDGVATISTEEQHMQTSLAIIRFVGWYENY